MTEVRVAVVRWPAEDAHREELRARHIPRLLVVPAGQQPPIDLDRLEDWASERADAAELTARVAALQARAAAALGAPIELADDVLRHGDRWVALGPIEAKIAAALIPSIGLVVSRRELEERAWGDAEVRANTTDRLVHRLRQHLRTVGLSLHTVRGRGYVLDRAPD